MRKLLLPVCAAIIFVACNTETTTKQNGETASSASSVESKEDRNKKIIMEAMDNFHKGDFDATFKDAAPGFKDYGDGTMPAVDNLDSLKAVFRMITTSIEGYKGEGLQYYADADKVLIVGDWTGTFKKDLFGIKATGKPVRFKDVDIFTVNDAGKITEHHSVQNFGAALMTPAK